MKSNPTTTPTETVSNRSSSSYFWLDSTLSSYEVEELDGFELTKFLTQFPQGAGPLSSLSDGAKPD